MAPERGPPTAKTERILAKSSGCCWYCGVTLDRTRFVIDHFISLKRGGSNLQHNLVPSCHPCNGTKHHFDLETYRRLHVRRHLLCIPHFSGSQKTWLLTKSIDVDAIVEREAEGLQFYFEQMDLQP